MSSNHRSKKEILKMNLLWSMLRIKAKEVSVDSVKIIKSRFLLCHKGSNNQPKEVLDIAN